MNRPIRILSIGCLVLFLALLVNANYLQFIAADSLNADNGNRRVLDEEFSRDRGPILVDGDPVARSVESDDEYDYQRVYPEAYEYAHLTGFFSFIYGRTGVENSQNSILSGSDGRLFVNRVVDLLGSDQPAGGSVELTIDPDAQDAAQEGLAALDDLGSGFKGSVTAVDPETGAILAMVNRPSYDPTPLASHDFDEVQRAYEDLLADKSDPTLNRATSETVPPGSTFKLITAAAAMEYLGIGPDDEVRGGSTLKVSSTYTVVNESDEVCGQDPLTLTQALEASCNVTFADLALKVGAEDLEKTAERFGFGERYLDDLSMSPSSLTPDVSALAESDDELARTGFGQQDVQATTLQMALTTAAVANGGEVMKPYLVDQVRAPDLELLDEADPQPLSGEPAMSSDIAENLRQMMVSVATNGTAQGITVPGTTIGAKTGTAQRGEDQPPYSWFVAFAPADDPQVAVAVEVEPPDDYPREDVSGGGIAGPIAQRVLEAVTQ